MKLLLFIMKLLRWDGWFPHCNTGSLRKHKPSVQCSVLLSNNYVIIKPCSRNIKGSTNLAYSENVNLEVPVRLSLQSLPLLLGKEKSTKCNYFATGRCFIHPLLIFYITTSYYTLHKQTCLTNVSERGCLCDNRKPSFFVSSYI